MTGTMLDQTDRILGRHNDPSTALADLRTQIPINDLWDALRAAPDRMAAMAERSYRHDNGFDKFVLSSAPASGLKLVLHVWRSVKNDYVDNIHDHRWDFASIVLCGSLRFDLYEPDRNGASYPVLYYSSPDDGHAYRMDPADDIIVARRASVIMTKGSSYRWNMSLLHRAWGVAVPLTVTLIVQGPAKRARTTVLVRSVRRDSGFRQITRLAETDVNHLLTELTAQNLGTLWTMA